LAEKGVRDLRVGQGQLLPGLEPAQWDLVHPARGYHPRLHEDNNRSVVSLVTYGGFKLLLPGDLEKPGIEELLRKNPQLKPLDWLMAPHHGRDSGQPALCERGLDPGFVVLSDYRDYPDARDQYQSGGTQVLSTAVDGAIEVELNADGTGRYRSYEDLRWKNLKALSLLGR
jgi:beta-lactamase superfamily II metal-dependent hydrolase